MAIWARNERLEHLVHHSDRGSQYTSIRYTNRLVDTGANPSVGTTGDSYDNALAESVIDSTRQNSSDARVRGKRSTIWSLQPSNGSIGTTTDGSTPPATARHQRNMKPTTTI